MWLCLCRRLRNLPLPRRVHSTLCDAFRTVYYTPGQTLAVGGSPADRLIVVKSGVVRITGDQPGGGRAVTLSANNSDGSGREGDGGGSGTHRALRHMSSHTSMEEVPIDPTLDIGSDRDGHGWRGSCGSWFGEQLLRQQSEPRFGSTVVAVMPVRCYELPASSLSSVLREAGLFRNTSRRRFRRVRTCGCGWLVAVLADV